MRRGNMAAARARTSVASALAALLLCVAGVGASSCTAGVSVVAAEAAAPGATTAVLVTLGAGVAAEVRVRLQADDADAAPIALASATVRGYGVVPLNIPNAPAGVYTLHTSVVSRTAGAGAGGGAGGGNCTTRSHSSLRLAGAVRDVIVRPARQHYRPGETVTFWVLALGHGLQPVRDHLAEVALRDSRGTKVTLWDQLSLEEGVVKLSATLAPGALAGTWRLEARCGGARAHAELAVSSAPPAPRTAAPSAPAAAERHSVELRFADGMRRRYKPGLPFVGRVEAVSTERHVRVRVKLYDNDTDIYSQDVDMASGEGAFVVPTVLASAPYLYLQAELVAVEGKEIETHYVLARERIKRWNSTARCYLLIENLSSQLQAGSTGRASVWSSCGCAQRMLAVITSGGRAVHWSTVTPATTTTPATAPATVASSDTGGLCRFNYTFPVEAAMAPASSLLVYYVTGRGEPVGDVAALHVRLLDQEMAVVTEDRRWWYPRAALQLRVRATLAVGSTLCLVGARAPAAAAGSAERLHEWSGASGGERAGEAAPELVSAGVSLFVGGAGGGGVLYRRPASAAGASTMTGARAELLGPDPRDRLWMWKCFNYTSELWRSGVTVAAPPDAGRWSLWALALAADGVRHSPPTAVHVLRPLQLDFTLPPALRVGETVELDVAIANNIDTCTDVTALLALSAGATFASTGMLYVTERLRLGPRGATTLVVRVAVDTPGHKNITVEVTGYSADNCSVSYGSYNNETLVGSVVRTATVHVLPEGIQRSDVQSAYFCANEHVVVSTRSAWEWQWVPAPRNRAGLVLELRARGPAHVALSGETAASADMYRVVIDGARVWLARGEHGHYVHLASATQTESAECAGGWCAWWVWWEGGRLAVGRGASPHERQLLSWPLAPAAAVRYVGFSSPWGDVADFRIWNFNEEAGFSQVLELALPRGVVPGSAGGELLISGGLHLPHVPHAHAAGGTHAHAVAALAPLLALEHAPHLTDDAGREEILKKLPEQIQTLLSFRNEDNSFSDHKAMSSHLSTIQTLEILTKIQSYYPVDPELLQSIKTWVHSKQNSDGAFLPLPADVNLDYHMTEEIRRENKEIIGKKAGYDGVKSNASKKLLDEERIVEVTAETLATLLKIGVENEEDASVVRKAQSYLERSLRNITSPASLASTVYALILARSAAVSEALAALHNASTTEEGEFGWPAPAQPDWLLEDTSGNIKPTLDNGALVQLYAATVRVLLAACARGALAEGEAAARYLYYRAPTLRAHPALLYPATKAAAQYAQLAYDRHRALTVSLATAGMELTDTVELRARSPVRLLQLPGLPTKVFVYATGGGCATVQGTTTYSTYTVRPDNGLLSIQSAIIDEIRPQRSSIEDLQGTLPTLNIKTCFSWKSRQRSGTLRLEVSLFSGYELRVVSPVVLDGGNFADLEHGSRGHLIWFLLTNVSSTCPVCITYQVGSHYVISALRPAFAKIYPISRPDLAVETFFHARPSSSLLKGTTDDDFITWFDRTQASSLNSNQSIDSICECGRVCRQSDFGSTDATIQPTTRSTKLNSTPLVDINTEPTRKTLLIKKKTTENETVINATKPLTSSHFINPIIYPTVTYTNKSHDNQTFENVLTPAIDRSGIGEIIVQKSMLPTDKGVLKKSLKKKTLPRRKGTLKSTYGDKHELLFFKQNSNNKTGKINVSKQTNVPEIATKSTEVTTAITEAFTTRTPTKITIPITTATTPNDNFFIVKNSKLISNIAPQAMPLRSNFDKVNKIDLSNNNNTTTVDRSSLSPLITQPTAPTGHAAPGISSTTQDIKMNETTDFTPSTSNTSKLYSAKIHLIEKILDSNETPNNNKKYVQTLDTSKLEHKTSEMYSVKPFKSINKEIHKIPPTPFSETSKTFSSIVKDKQLSPENRDGFVVLEKNQLWELLKEETRPLGVSASGMTTLEDNHHAEIAHGKIRSV